MIFEGQLTFNRMFQKLPRSLQSILEQALQSAYSFVIVAVAGRLLTQIDFGVFSLIWSAFPIFLLLFSSIIIRPLSITYPAATKNEQYEQELFGIEIQNFFLKFSIVLFLFGAIFSFISLKFTNVTLILLGASLILIRLRAETIRRINIVQNNLEKNFLNSAVMYFPAIIVLPLMLFFLPQRDSSNAVDYFLIAVFSLLAFPSFFIAINSSFRDMTFSKNHRNVWASYYKYGKDLITAAIIETVFKRIAPYLMVIGAGVAEAGTWAIGRLLVGPAQVVLLGVSNAALPDMRKAYAIHGSSALNREFRLTCLTMLVLYIVPLLILALYASFIIELLIGVIYPGAKETLQVYCIAFMIMGCNTMFSTYLQARGNVRQQLVSSTLSSIIYILGLLYIVPNAIGAVRVAVLSMLSEIATFIVYAAYVINVIKNENENEKELK